MMETVSKNVKLTESPPTQQRKEEADAVINVIAHELTAKPFRPHRMFHSGHAQTLAAYAWRRSKFHPPHKDEARLFEVEPDIRVRALCRWQSTAREHPTIILVHGLEGSSESGYMLSTAGKAHRAGFNVVRLNLRNCGGTEHLTPTLYNSGMTGDLLKVAQELIERDRLQEIFLAGFSLGGNMILKLAGERGENLPRELKGICAVSPPLDLSACINAIEWRSNWIYHRDFINGLRRRIRRKHRLFPDRYDIRDLRKVRTIRQFDTRYTAVDGGYRSVEDYYARASALPYISFIRRPTLIIHAQDDPFIPFDSFRHPSIANNSHIIFMAPPHGGHVGFISDKTHGEDRFWAENRAVEFCRLVYERMN